MVPAELDDYFESAAVEVDLRDFIDGITGFYAGMANVAMQMAGASGMAYGVMESKQPGRIDKRPVRRLRTTLTTGLVYRRLPRVARNMPFNVFLWDVRRRMRANQPLI